MKKIIALCLAAFLATSLRAQSQLATRAVNTSSFPTYNLNQVSPFLNIDMTNGALLVEPLSGGSGGTTANQGTAASVNAGWPVINGELSPDTTGTFTNGTQTASITTGTIDGYGQALVSINGTYATASGVFEMSDDGGTTWYPVQASRTDGTGSETGYTGLTNTNRMWVLAVSGADTVRVRSTAVATGTVNVRISVSSPVPTSGASLTISGGTGQQAAATSVPVALANEDVQDLYMIGQAAQTATINNILPNGTASANATDATGYRSASVQVVSTGTGGTFIFEGSDDNVNFVALSFFNQTSPAAFLNSPVTASAAAPVYVFPITTRYIRLRIATLITGGSIQAFSKISQVSYSPAVGISNISFTGATSVPAQGGPESPHPLPAGGATLSVIPSAPISNGLALNLSMDGDQRLITHENGDPSNEWTATSGITPLATNTSTTLNTAGSAGVRNYVTAIQCWNTSATVSTTISILDGATVIWTGFLPATTAALAVVPVVVRFPTNLRGSTTTAINIQCGTTGASVYYNVQGYRNN